jgi:hypothetical protein
VSCVCCMFWEMLMVDGLFEDDAGVEVWVQVMKGVGWGPSNDGYWVEVDVM